MVATIYITEDSLEGFQKVDITKDKIRMRVREPGTFENGSFRTIRATSGVQFIIGRPKGKKTTKVQSVLFDNKKFNEAQAKKWFRDHRDEFQEAIRMEKAKEDLFSIHDVVPSLNPRSVFNVDEMMARIQVLEAGLQEHIRGHLPRYTEEGQRKLLKAWADSGLIVREDIIESSIPLDGIFDEGEPEMGPGDEMAAIEAELRARGLL